MNLFGLIIQGTTAGFKDLYVSENIQATRSSAEIEKTAIDEREFATRLANQSDVYAIQVTQNYRVYSLIITSITDFVGGAGFYAIRLYCPKSHSLKDFEILLQKINEKYLEFEQSGTLRNNQDYDDLLRYDLSSAVSQSNYIAIKSKEEAFCLFNVTSELDSFFNHKAIGLFNKVYAFNRESAVSAEIINSLGLKSFEETEENLKELSINNNYRILNELKVNQNPVEFNRNDSQLTLILKKDSIVEYNTTDNSKFRQSTQSFYVERKHQPKPPKQNGPKQLGFIERYGVYIVMLIMISVLGFGSWYYLLDGDKIIKGRKEIVYDEPMASINSYEEGRLKDSVKIVFQHYGSPKDSSVFKTDYPELDKYRFRLDNKKWSYKNTQGKDEYVEFYKKNLDEINNKDTLNLDSIQKIEFLNGLEKIGQQKILDAPLKITPVKDTKPNDTKKKNSSNEKKPETSSKSNKSNDSKLDKSKTKDGLKVDGASKL